MRARIAPDLRSPAYLRPPFHLQVQMSSITLASIPPDVSALKIIDNNLLVYIHAGDQNLNPRQYIRILRRRKDRNLRKEALNAGLTNHFAGLTNHFRRSTRG